MDIEIIDFLKTSVSPEVADVYQTSFDLFGKFNLEDYSLLFDEIYALVDDYDINYIQCQLDSALDELLQSLLRQHGIFVIDNTDFKTMNDILSAIYTIADYEDTDAVLTIIDTDQSDTEKLAEILSLMTDTTVETLMQSIILASPGTIKRISEIYTERKALLEEHSNTDAFVTKEKAAWIKRLYSLKDNAFSQCKITKLFSQLEEGLKFNLEFSFYTGLLWTEVSELNMPEIARELLGMAIISSDRSEKALETIQEFISINIGDIDQIARISEYASQQFLLSKRDNGISLNN